MTDETSTLPRWITASLEIKVGLDPLGLQTTTQDRLMPRLLPSVLELSVRARYLSFHAFLLDEYRLRRLPSDSRSLSTFMKQREWEYGLAVLACPHQCGSAPVGANRLRPLMKQSAPAYPRGESVESPFGGYGLYYRSLLADFGIVARAGTLLGDRPTTVDVLTNSYRARRIVECFRSAVEATDYYQRWMRSTELLLAEVLRDYAEVACLCRLPHFNEERDAVHDAFFQSDPRAEDAQIHRNPGVNDGEERAVHPTLEKSGDSVVQRCRSFAHFLSLVRTDPAVVDDESAYREALWSPPAPQSAGEALVAGHWSALIAKDIWQEAICSVWSDFCRSGLARTRELGRGMTALETEELARSLVTGMPELDPDTKTASLAEDLATDRIEFDGGIRPSQLTLESLRRWAVSTDTATAGLILILELDRRAASHHGQGWNSASHLRSVWQPSVASVLNALKAEMSGNASTSDTVWWLVEQFVLPVHERIAYSKLPEFTFRFRWEEGLLCFFDQGIGRFPLAAIRWRAFASLSHDLGLWDRGQGDKAKLSTHGNAFMVKVFDD